MWATFRAPCDENLVRAGGAAVSCPKARGRWVLAATILASSMAFIDGTVVNVALPSLQATFNATAVDVQWVVESYSLLLSAFVLVGGSLGDRYGHRRVFLIGVAIFALASAACGAAANLHQLIAARGIQGFGAALLVPGSLAIISNSFSEHDRGRAIGTWSAFSAITAGLGPVLGGWLIEHISWRAVFLINLPLAIAVTLIALRHVPENSNAEKTHTDWLGAILAATGLGALVYGLIESSRLGFSNRIVTALLLLAALILSAFVLIEARISRPMLPLALFRSPLFAVTNLITFLLYAALGGTLFFLPLNLIQVQHYSATSAGAALLPFILILSLLSRWSGALVGRYGAKLPLVIGPAVAAVSFALFMVPTIGGTYWATFFPAVTTLGLGMAISVAPLTTSVMSSVAQNRAGIASGVNNAVARTAGLVAIAILGIVMLTTFTSRLDRNVTSLKIDTVASSSILVQSTKLAAIDIPEDQPPPSRKLMRAAIDEAFVFGFRTIMAIGALLALAAALVALTVKWKLPPLDIRTDPPMVSSNSRPGLAERFSARAACY